MRALLRHHKVGTLQSLYKLSLGFQNQKFMEACRNPEATLTSRLMEYVRSNEQTRFGRKHGFSSVRTVDDYRKAVPIRDYDGHLPWIEAAMAGEAKVLTEEPIVVFEKTGGSTSANKFIPYTQSLRKEFERGMAPWFVDVMSKYPGLRGTRLYWSISPVAQQKEYSAGGIRIGGTEDTDYFSPLGKWIWQQILAAPMELARIEDMDQWRHQTALHLLKADDLGLISIWSPTFATHIFAHIEAHWEALLSELPSTRARTLKRQMAGKSGFDAGAAWPRLQFVSCWADGVSEQFIPELKRYLGSVPIQGKGLLATEGLITTPWGEEGASPVFNPLGHFVEFLPADGDGATTVLPHELAVGQSYSPVLTNAGGLYRYHLKDRITCVGHTHRLPRLRFEGKMDRVSDLVGEKISAAQVESLLDSIKKRLGLSSSFAMLAPNAAQPPHYTLFVESSSDDKALSALTEALEDGLRKGHHYDYARSLGQLGSLQFQRVVNGSRIYEDTLVAGGQRRGDIKATCLDKRVFWQKAFSAQN